MVKINVILLIMVIVLIILLITILKSINYIINILNEVLQGNYNRRIMTYVWIKPLKTLINKVNQIIEKAQSMQNDNIAKENSMKKMISNISHDFRTPLTSMLGYIELMMDDENISRENSRYLSIVYNKGINLSKMFEEFFQVSKLNSNDMEVHLERINLCELIRKNIISYFNEINKKNIKPLINLPEEDVYIISDEKMLNRVFDNIINNSLIHGKEATVIGIDLKCDNENVHIEIYDNGVGINEDQIEYIFDRLYMGDKSRNEKIRGSGLGLSIVKKIIEVLKGSIKAESRPLERTSFKISLKRDLRYL